MPKKILSLLLAGAFTLGLSAGALAAGEASSSGGIAAYEIVVPLEHDQIDSINGGLFITKETADIPFYKNYCLFDFAGRLILGGMDDMKFADGYIFAKGADGWGVFSREGREIVPQKYAEVVMMDAEHCAANEGAEFHRPGYYVGNCFLYDLTTGKIDKALGYGGTPEPPFDENTNWWRDVQFPLTYGDAAVSPVRDENAVARPDSTRAYNRSGQLTLDFSKYIVNGVCTLGYACAGYYLVGYTQGPKPQNGMTYLFTGRGRSVMSGVDVSMVPLVDERFIQVISVTGESRYIADCNGREVIAPGVFDIYEYNRYDDYGSTTISDSNDDICVSKDGKWGIIRLTAGFKDTIGMLPSAWAADGIAAAEARGMLPEDMRFWLRDSCTREEFCRLLAIAMKDRGDGSPIQDGGIASFSDCDNPDVTWAAELGIVNGVGGGRFAPYRFITREQAAVMLSRALRSAGVKPEGRGAEYADRLDFSDWAADDIYAVSAVKTGSDGEPLMRGTGEGRFSPGMTYTVEQAVITMLRLTGALDMAGGSPAA